MMNRRGFLGLMIACPLCAQAARAASATHWGYEGEHGPEHWGDLSGYEACAVGGEQSPIDLKDAALVNLDPLVIDWKPQAFKVKNNGHTIEADPQAGGSLRIGDQIYELQQFHFHTPSEHALNGQKTTMEAHFVHAKGGQRAVVGVFLTGGGANSAFSEVMAIAPPKESEEGQLTAPIDIKNLLPAKGPLYRYEGSLTTPPCSETIKWNVYGVSVAVADHDIDAFKRIFRNNARPLQPLNGRSLQRTVY